MSVAQRPESGLGRLVVEVSKSHTHTYTLTHTHKHTHTHTSGLQDVSHGISEIVLGIELITKFLIHFVLLKYNGKCVMGCKKQNLNILPTQTVYLCIYMNLTTDCYNSSEPDVFVS